MNKYLIISIALLTILLGRFIATIDLNAFLSGSYPLWWMLGLEDNFGLTKETFAIQDPSITHFLGFLLSMVTILFLSMGAFASFLTWLANRK